MKELSKTKKYFNNRGFTLVELLVVISIIGLLASLAMVSLTSARVKARDALRLGEVAQLRTALNLFYDDNNRYPLCGTWIDDEAQDFGAVVGDNIGEGCDCYLNALSVDLEAGERPIMQQTPRDPKNETNNCAFSAEFNYRYVSTLSGDEYALFYTLENEGEKYIRGW